MAQCKNFTDVIEKLVEIGEIDAYNAVNSVDDVANVLIAMGNQEHVYAFHDEHLGMKGDMTSTLLETKVVDVTDDHYENLVDQANTIIGLSTRTISGRH